MPSERPSTPPTDGVPELVAGFRIERSLGRAVWEASQPELGRRVALHRLAPGTAFSAAQWPERPGVVRLYAAVDDASGTYVATQFLEGARTLAERRAAGARPADVRRWLDEAAATLEGTVHGALGDDAILIDTSGHALLTGYGRAGDDASPAADRAALDRLRPARRPHAVRVGAPVAAAAVLVAGVVLLVGRGDGADPAPRVAPAPPPTAGAVAVGSALAGGDTITVDCEGAPPSGSSEPCTVMQAALPGRSLVAPAAGIARAWSVRGVSGRVALQILTPAGDGFVAYNRSPIVTIDDPGVPRVIASDLSVPAGARFALEITPGGAVGLHRGRPGARTARFFGPLRGIAQAPDTAAGGGEELLLRVDVVPRG